MQQRHLGRTHSATGGNAPAHKAARCGRHRPPAVRPLPPGWGSAMWDAMRRFLFRAHIWLGWLVGGQLLLWMLSGLVMTAMPIEAVRGTHLRAEPPALPLAQMEDLLPPEAFLSRAGPGADGLLLTSLLGRPVYRLLEGAEVVALFDARTGERVVIDGAMAGAIARSRYAGPGSLAGVSAVDPDRPPLEFRRDRPAYAARFDGPEAPVFYVDAVSGELLAVRTNRWRLFDLMWGLHIMDWRAREDFNHPLLVGAAALGLLAVLGGIVLLVLRAWHRQPRAGALAAAPRPMPLGDEG